jgi:glucosamine--fructose-6-phosphate aminotransferase (isomerizing)
MPDHRLPVIEGAYLRDLLDQPAALAATHASFADHADATLETLGQRLRAGGFRDVVLTGMGSSCHALVPLQLRLIDSGQRARVVETSELLHYQQRLLDSAALLVIASQSGRSAEVVRLLETIRGRGVATVAVTNTAASPLTRAASSVVLTRAGEEATVSCKTYVAAQMALAMLGAWLTGADVESTRADLGNTVAAAAEYLAGWREHVAALARRLDGVGSLYFAGRGPSLAAALTAGLITKESTHRPAEGMSSAAFRHGPLEMADERLVLLVFAGEPRTRALNEALVLDARGAGARSWLVSEQAAEPEFRLPVVAGVARPVLELLPVEMITLALAALDGREAGRFERATKVTAAE